MRSCSASSGRASYLSKDRTDRFLLDVWEQVAVPPPLFLRLVSYEVIDNPLIDAGCGEAGNEAVSQRVVALHPVPPAAGQRAAEVVVGFVLGHCPNRRHLPWSHSLLPALL